MKKYIIMILLTLKIVSLNALSLFPALINTGVGLSSHIKNEEFNLLGTTEFKWSFFETPIMLNARYDIETNTQNWNHLLYLGFDIDNVFINDIKISDIQIMHSTIPNFLVGINVQSINEMNYQIEALWNIYLSHISFMPIVYNIQPRFGYSLVTRDYKIGLVFNIMLGNSR